MKQEFNIKEVVLIKSFEYKLLIRLCQLCKPDLGKAVSFFSDQATLVSILS